MPSVDLACCLGKFGSYTLQVFCRSLLCYVGGRFVKDFYGNKRIKDSFYFFVLYLLQKLCLPILTISLQVNFFQIHFI